MYAGINIIQHETLSNNHIRENIDGGRRRPIRINDFLDNECVKMPCSCARVRPPFFVDPRKTIVIQRLENGRTESVDSECIHVLLNVKAERAVGRLLDRPLAQRNNELPEHLQQTPRASAANCKDPPALPCLVDQC